MSPTTNSVPQSPGIPTDDGELTECKPDCWCRTRGGVLPPVYGDMGKDAATLLRISGYHMAELTASAYGGFFPAPWLRWCGEAECWGIDPETGRHLEMGHYTSNHRLVYPTGRFNDACPRYVREQERIQVRNATSTAANDLLMKGRI